MRTAKGPAELGFNHHDERRLKKALKQAVDKRVFQRVQAVLLVAQGRAISDVADISGVTIRSVYNWVNCYLEQHHVAALSDGVRGGRPPVAKRITAARLLGELRRNPLRLGYRTTVWTVRLLAKHLSQLYQCAISPRTLRRRMK